MGETVINVLAMFVGSVAIILTLVPAIFRAIRDLRPDPEAHRLLLKVDDQTFEIDAGAIDREDTVKIERAIQAVRQAVRIPA